MINLYKLKRWEQALYYHMTIGRQGNPRAMKAAYALWQRVGRLIDAHELRERTVRKDEVGTC